MKEVQVIEQVKEALALALTMLDPENQPPQFSLTEAYEKIKAAYDAINLQALPQESSI